MTIVPAIARWIDEHIVRSAPDAKARNRTNGLQLGHGRLPARNSGCHHHKIQNQSVGRQPGHHHRLRRQPLDELANEFVRFVERWKHDLLAGFAAQRSRVDGRLGGRCGSAWLQWCPPQKYVCGTKSNNENANRDDKPHWRPPPRRRRVRLWWCRWVKVEVAWVISHERQDPTIASPTPSRARRMLDSWPQRGYTALQFPSFTSRRSFT